MRVLYQTVQTARFDAVLFEPKLIVLVMRSTGRVLDLFDKRFGLHQGIIVRALGEIAARMRALSVEGALLDTMEGMGDGSVEGMAVGMDLLDAFLYFVRTGQPFTFMQHWRASPKMTGQ